MTSDGACGQGHRFRGAKYLSSGVWRRGLPCAASLLGLLVVSAASASGASASAAAPALRPAAAPAPRPVGPRGPQVIQARPRIPAGARPVGTLRSSAQISGDVVLKPRDNAAIQRFVAEVTDKNSPLFHNYLPAGAFASRFGPSKSAIHAAVSLLKADGLHVTGVSSDGLFIHFRGSAAVVGAAFHTGLESYRLRDGFVGRATTSAVRLPARIAGSVAAVLGLDDLVQLRPVGLVRRPAADRGKVRPATVRPATAPAFSHPAGAPRPCKAAQAAATVDGGLTADQIGHAYGAFGLYGSGDLGQGQHIAIYELEPFARSDVKTFDTCFYGATAAAKMQGRLHVHSVDGGQPAGSGSGEAILDVEDVSGIAPDATIDVYVGPSPGTDGTAYDPVDEYAAIINSDADQVVSTSWGLCEQAIQAGQPGLQVAENLLFEQAAAQGQSVFAAAGDNGSDDCTLATTPVSGQNPVSVDDPGSQPYVLSVGGTTIDDAATQPPLEHVWNDGPNGGAGGGGISQSWTMSTWQRNAAVPGIVMPGSPTYARANKIEKAFGYPTNFCQGTVAGANSSTPCRLVPDVSSQADEFTGAMTVYQAVFGGWGPTGGTSSATPIWAALLALVNASPTCAAHAATHRGVGFASPLLYAVASDPGAYHAAFNDIRTGNNDEYGLDNGLVFDATKGYDLASGLGSAQLTGPGGKAGLAYYLCSLGAKVTRPVVTSIRPALGSVAGGEHIRIHGFGFESGGSSDVAAVQFGAAHIPASELHVLSARTIIATVPTASASRPPIPPAPQDSAGPADVIVTLKDHESSAPGPASTFEYVDTTGHSVVPSVTGVVPYAGSESTPGTVTILGSGFTGATSVTFGGVSASHWTVRSPYEITALAPAYSPSTVCAPLPVTGVFAGENATNDICQVQVQVGNAHGLSGLGTILPPDEGPVVTNALGVLVAPSGCSCETAQAPTEYDYVPQPTITSVSTSGAANLASEQGGTVITVHGTGLDPLTIDWADFGPPSQEFSQDTSFVFMTGTEMQIAAPGAVPTVDTSTVPFSVKSLAGQSSQVAVTYAGIPSVTSVVNTRNHTNLHGIYGAPDTGGSPLTIGGSGFAGQLQLIQFVGVSGSQSSGTQYSFRVGSDTKLSAQSVQQNAALVDVELCTASGCSGGVRRDRLYIYAPGNPDVTSASPRSGPAGGGTKVTIDGHNLGCALGVFFGKVKAKSFTPTPASLYCGSTITLTATSPKGSAGKKVPVSVETVESYFSHTGHGTTTANFTYK